MPEIIKSGYNGFIVDVVSSQALCKKMFELATSEDYKKLTKNALDTSKKFTIENTIASLEKNYKELL